MNTITKPLPPLLATCQASETPVTCYHSFMDAEQTPQQVAPHTLIAKFNFWSNSDWMLWEQWLWYSFSEIRRHFGHFSCRLAEAAHWLPSVDSAVVDIDTYSAKDIPTVKMAFCLFHGRCHCCWNKLGWLLFSVQSLMKKNVVGLFVFSPILWDFWTSWLNNQHLICRCPMNISCFWLTGLS